MSEAGTDLGRLCARIAGLHRELAAAQEQLGVALVEGSSAAAPGDQVLSLKEAASLMGEPVETFRKRLEYRKARVTRPGEHRQRFSRRALERILADRLATNGDRV